MLWVHSPVSNDLQPGITIFDVFLQVENFFEDEKGAYPMFLHFDELLSDCREEKPNRNPQSFWTY